MSYLKFFLHVSVLKIIISKTFNVVNKSVINQRFYSKPYRNKTVYVIHSE